MISLRRYKGMAARWACRQRQLWHHLHGSRFYASISERDSLWRDYFRDPSQWLDNRKSKTSPRAPDFKHRNTKDCLWIDGRYNPPWVQEELRRNGLVISEEMMVVNEKGIQDEGSEFVTLLRACAKKRDLIKGTKLHADILNMGLLGKNLYVANNLISMYAKCGAFEKAEQVLYDLPVRDVISWSALIAGYVQNGHCEKALKCFELMQREGLTPDAVSFSCILKACGSLGAADRGEKVHAEIERLGLLEKDVILGNALVNMYAKCGALSKAQEVFDVLPVRDVFTWTALIAGYVQQGYNQEAITCFEQMQSEGISPTAVTSTCILTAYANSGALARAQQVFDGLHVRDVISWSALISGYSQYGQGEEALTCFEQMLREGIAPNAVTFTCILKACGSLGAAEKGGKIHSEIVRKGLLRKDIMLANSLIDMYVNCGLLVKAQEVLDELPVRDVASWNILIAGYARQGSGKEALNCLKQMQREGLSPNSATFASILKACGNTGSTENGEKIHAEIVSQGLLGKDIVLSIALVEMYAKCGVLTKAEEVLRDLPVQDTASWTALIAGYGLHGQGKEALKCFERMLGEGVPPDAMTFSCVLNACSHNGLVDEGEMHYMNMSSNYGIVPDSVHHTCMVDIFGRAGHFDKALALIKKVPSSPSQIPMWRALLGACRLWGDVKHGRLAFEHIIQLDKKHAAAYILMSNIYAAVGMREDADKIEAMRVENGAWKMVGCCWWTDSSGTVHSFVVRDRKHPQSKEIYAKLDELGQKLSQEGYSPGLQSVSQKVSDDSKEDVLCGHSEKLAIACALINNTPAGTPIRVVKNMRMCGDCHVATALISKIENHQIVVRDASRFHVFQDGKCNCGDYW